MTSSIFGELEIQLQKNTWLQKTPLNQTRLDFWLLNDFLQDEISDARIIPSIKADHSGISLRFSSIDKQKPVPSHWKFSSTGANL